MPTETGQVREQAIELAATKQVVAAPPPWRRIEIQLQAPTESGDQSIVLWSNLPASIEAASDYQGMLIALPSEVWQPWSKASAGDVAQHLLRLAGSVSPRSVATAKRGPKKDKPEGYVASAVARKQLSTARVLTQAAGSRP